VPIPKAIRSRVPNRVRDNPKLRAIALASGLIAPRPMHSPAEAALLARLANRARCVVEIGVYEGSSALVLRDALSTSAQLHLIDPFVDQSGWSLRPDWRASPVATKLALARRPRGTGPNVCWHIARSQDVGRDWRGPAVDLVFIDGDHHPDACLEDWDVWHPHVRPGGWIAFHDARDSRPGGSGSPGPTCVVDRLFRASGPPEDWSIAEECDTMVVVQRAAAAVG